MLAQHRIYPNITQENNHCEDNHKNEVQEENCTEFNSDIEDVEFNVTEDMLNFFETSERHRRELQQKRKSKIMHNKEDSVEEIPIIDDAERVCIKEQEANLLYGDDASKILAMETALETARNEYKDTMNPQYWPNIPLKP